MKKIEPKMGDFINPPVLEPKIVITLEEYKELLIVKGKYEILKEIVVKDKINEYRR